eukprot:RCo013356
MGGVTMRDLAKPAVLVPVVACLGITGVTAWVTTSWTPVLASLGWAAMYTVVCGVLKRNTRPQMLEGYPRWSYFLSVVHQGLCLPVIWLLLLRARHSMRFTTWLNLTWQGPPHPLMLEQLVHCSIIGAMMKDFWVYGDLNQWFFVVHHLLTVVGDSLCLCVPSGVGIVTLNALNAEVLSVAYNIKVLYPSTASRLAHLVLMGLSNTGGVALSVLFALRPIPLWWRVVYCSLAGMILAFRCAGWFITIGELKGSGREKEDERE